MPTPIKGLPHVGDSWRNTETDESGTVVGYAPDVPYMGEDGKLYPTTSPVVKYDSGETLFGVTPQYTLPEVTATGHLSTPADNLDKVMLGTLAAGVAPMALPEIASGTAAALANPYVDAALTSYFGAHGINDIANGNANAMTALEVLPMARLAKPLWNAGKSAVNYMSEIAPEVDTFITSPYTGKWATFGNRQYRFKPGNIGMNGVPVESRAANQPLTITAENAASITPEQWTAAQDAAIARGDMVEAQRLADLHSNMAAQKEGFSVYDTYHGQAFKDATYRFMGLNPYSDARVRSGYFSVPSIDVARTYNQENGAPVFSLHTYLRNPFITDAKGNSWQQVPIYNLKGKVFRTTTTDKLANQALNNGLDGVIVKNVDDIANGSDLSRSLAITDDYISAAGRNKLRDAVTYDDNGIRIPLGDRHNFNIKDTRWGILGPIVGATGYGLYDSFNSTNSDVHAYGGPLHKRWNDLSIKEKSDMMKVAISNGITNLSDIKDKYNEFAMGGDTVGEWANAIYSNNPKEEFLGEPSHHYDFTQTDEWADAHGYYPDARGHRDDRIKKPTHPSHPSRGTWDGDKFILSDLGMQNPNYTLFGLNDGGQDPQAILTYRGGSVIPEITATPKGNYIENPYDNTKFHFAEGGNLYSGGGYVYDILPQLFAMDGVPVTVTSGYRPGARVQGTNRLSRHARHEAVDLRGDFAKMQQVLNNPNSNVARWMLANGYGYLNEAPTFGGTTKYWPRKYFRPDGTPDFHDHFHIGKDFGSKYTASFRGVPQQQQPRAMYTGNGWRNIAADNIMRHEGFMQHSYADAPKGKSWRSIGYGFNDSGFYNKYPMGISKYYDARGGITRAEAQQELNYMLDNMERQARAAYGSRWDQFNDNQKAAIMDTMYQRPASVLKGSQFHRAIMAGDPNAVNYLGVSGFDKRNADRRGLFGSPSQYTMQQPMMMQQNPFPDFQPSNPQAFYGQGNSAIDREMAEKMANMEATMKAYQEAQEQQQLAAARQAERQEKAARANLAWNFVMGMNGDNQQQSPYMGLLGALSSNAIMGEE